MYNKAHEERKWRRWKSREEQIMRQNGMPEYKIQELHRYDLAMFNADRRFREKQFTDNDLIDYVGVENIQLPIRDFEDVLNQIDDLDLYQQMRKLNEQTMIILYLKICGYSIKEIAEISGLKENAIRERIRSIRKKLKKD